MNNPPSPLYQGGIIKNITIFGTVWLLLFFSLASQVKADNSYDLKADSLIMNSAKCEINQICSFTAKVKNSGADFTFNFPLKSSLTSANFIADAPVLISPASNTVIKTNDYITFALSGVYRQPGQAALTFAINSFGYLTESNAGNNSIGLTVNVSGYDLAAESMNISPPNPRVNQNCYLKIKVKNNSSYNLYAETGLDLARSFQDFSVTNGSSTVPSFANVIHNGGYLDYGYEGKFTSSGEKQFSFTIDPGDVLKESNLANNTVVKKINVYEPSDTDLAVDSVIFSAAKIIAGQAVDLTVSVKNTGKTSLTDGNGLSRAEFSFSLPNFEYGINDLILDVYPTLSAPLNPAGIFHYKFHGAFNKPGNFNLAFSINQDKQLTESTLNNNATTTAVRVYGSLSEADDFTVVAKNVWLVSSTTAIINWRTSLKTTGVLNYNQAHYNVNDNKIDVTDKALDHAITLNKLKLGANYIYAITAKNGTVEKTEIISGFSLPENDVLKATSGPNLNVSGKNATFGWTTNLISSGQVYYKNQAVAAVSRAGSDTLTAEHQMEIKDLAPGAYDYFLSSTSTPGTNFKTGWASFEIKAAPAAAPAASATTTALIKTEPAAAAPVSFPITNSGLYEKLKGKIILRVESQGEAYYISPKDKKIYYLGRPADGFQVIRSQAVGITNGDLEKIPVNLSALSGADSDSDGLPDAFEDALGTAKNKADTDGDGFDDKVELAGGFSPLAKDKKMNYDKVLADKQRGKILLQVQGRGQAWYVNPADGQRYFLANPADGFNLMRRLAVGVTNTNYQTLGGK